MFSPLFNHPQLLPLLAGAMVLFSPLAASASSLFVEPDDPRLSSARLITIEQQGFTQVVIDGYIHPPTVDAFRKKVSAAGNDFGIVYFNSAGGDLSAAQQLGRLIREHGYATQIGKLSQDQKRIEKGICESACPIAFIGGKFRLLDSQTGQLGVHRFYLAKQGRWAADSKVLFTAERDLKAYLDEMGIDPEFFEVMMKTPAERIQPITLKSAFIWKVATGGEYFSWTTDTDGHLVGLGETSTGGMAMTFNCRGGTLLAEVRLKPWFPAIALLNYETHSITVNGIKHTVDEAKIGMDKATGFLTIEAPVGPDVLASLAGAESIGYSMSYDSAPGEYSRALRVEDGGSALRAVAGSCQR